MKEHNDIFQKTSYVTQQHYNKQRFGLIWTFIRLGQDYLHKDIYYYSFGIYTPNVLSSNLLRKLYSKIYAVYMHLYTVEPPKTDSPYYGNLHKLHFSPCSVVQSLGATTTPLPSPHLVQ